VPPHENQIPNLDIPSADENPFCCLREDDQLVTSVSVATDRWLDPNADEKHVCVMIHVNVKATVRTHGNMSI
jgi:hypothetical protein